MVAKFEANLWFISQVGETGDPIAHVEISLLPPIDPLQNLLGVMGMAEYDDINPLAKFVHGEGPEYWYMSYWLGMVLSAASRAQSFCHLHG